MGEWRLLRWKGQTMKVAFVGLGNMGQSMARNILKAGHELTVFNRTRSKMEALVEAGASPADSPCQAAQGAEVLCISVSTPDAVRAVVLGDEGALSGASPAAIFIDFSTVDPLTSQEVAGACAQEGIAFLDAPVSGGVSGAEAGTLTVIVGGDAEAFDRVQAVFEAVGQNITHVGPSGAGSTIKLVNQILVGVNLAAVAEAFVAARVAGVDPQVLCDILSTSAGGSFMLDHRMPGYILEGNFEAGFAVNMLCKDLDLALEMGKGLHTPLFMPTLARQIYEEARAMGLGEKDVAAVILPMERRHGIEVRGDKD
jgi:3-hydroxyisobutyrate dehydrogenase